MPVIDFITFKDHPGLHSMNKPTSAPSDLDFKKEMTVFNANLGTWNHKLGILQRKLSPDSLFLYFVRDPRSWINVIMWDNKVEPGNRNEILRQLIDNFTQDDNFLANLDSMTNGM